MTPWGFSCEVHSSFLQAQSLRQKGVKHLSIFEEEKKWWPPCWASVTASAAVFRGTEEEQYILD